MDSHILLKLTASHFEYLIQIERQQINPVNEYKLVLCCFIYSQENPDKKGNKFHGFSYIFIIF